MNKFEAMFQLTPTDFQKWARENSIDITPTVEDTYTQCQNQVREIAVQLRKSQVRVCSKPPTDRWSSSIIPALLTQTSAQFECFYFWSLGIENHLVKLKSIIWSKPNVVLVIKDHLGCNTDFNYWQDYSNVGVQLIKDICDQSPNTNFILFTSLYGVEKQFKNCSNLQVLCHGGDIVNQHDLYLELDPVLDKDLSSTKSFICLNRHRRPARVMLLSYLFGLELDQFGYISYLDRYEEGEFLDLINWIFDLPRQDAVRSKFEMGWPKIKNAHAGSIDIYPSQIPNDNVSNFEKNLRQLYRRSFVEITVETTYEEPYGALITEKTQNIFFGCNFPIILSNPGTIQHLRDMGMDMFDDVIDHSYDLIENPIDRLTQAIDLNKHILSNVDYARTQWLQCRGRMKTNVEKIRTIHIRYSELLQQEFNRLKWL